MDETVGAGANVAASKVQHKHRKTFSQSGTVVAAMSPIHVVTATTLMVAGQAATANAIAFRAGVIAPCTGNATITVDLQKNGVSLLTAPITLNSASVARTSYAGTITAGSLVAGDWLDVVATVSAGTGALGSGLLVQLEVDETAQ